MAFVLKFTFLVALILGWSSSLFAQNAAPHATRISLPPCLDSQLRPDTPTPPDGGMGHFAFVIQVTNSAGLTCQLRGVPRLDLLDQQEHRLSGAVCANCQDYLFGNKPIAPVILHSGESAHFLMGVVVVETPGRLCQKIYRVQISFKAGQTPVSYQLASPAETCGRINVSAWRAGIYQNK